jgi:hypothetical protein
MGSFSQAGAVGADAGVDAGVAARRGAAQRWLRRAGVALWLAGIAGFAALHAMHLRADFPNHSPWIFDWAKYTDEGWYGDAAVRAHLYGNWYMAGDFNPAVAVPVWPLLEWVLFCFTGVTIEAARALAVAVFFVNLALSYALLRTSGSRWMALFGVTLLVTSTFLFCFSRLAILEPLLTAWTLLALNVAVRLPAMRRPVWGAAGVGALAVLAALTKTTGVFLIPALGWAIAVPLWKTGRLAMACLAAAGVTFAAGYGLWLALIVRLHLLTDYRYYFFVNDYSRPPEWYWPAVSLYWSTHGLFWADKVLAPLAVSIVLVAILWGAGWGRRLLLDPVVGASVLGSAGMVLFMTIQNHPQPRYFAPVAFFLFFIVAIGAEALLKRVRGNGDLLGALGCVALVVMAMALSVNTARTIACATHPEYTFENAATNLTHYIDTHPSGKRLLVSISGDQITLATHLPSLCDDFGTMDLPEKIGAYQPGWYAAWNDLDGGTLEDLHTHFSLEQVASYPAFDYPDRNVLVLFKLHPLPNGEVRDPHDAEQPDLSQPLPEDSIKVPME